MLLTGRLLSIKAFYTHYCHKGIQSNFLKQQVFFCHILSFVTVVSVSLRINWQEGTLNQFFSMLKFVFET